MAYLQERRYASSTVKGVLNPNFPLFSFKLKKIKFFKINFDLGFRVLWPQTLKIFEILFPFSWLMTSSLEHLTTKKLSRQFNPH